MTRSRFADCLVIARRPRYRVRSAIHPLRQSRGLSRALSRASLRRRRSGDCGSVALEFRARLLARAWAIRPSATCRASQRFIDKSRNQEYIILPTEPTIGLTEEEDCHLRQRRFAQPKTRVDRTGNFFI